MYFDKEDAIEIIANAKEAIERLHNEMLTNHNNIKPNEFTQEIRKENKDAIYKLECSIEKLEKALINCHYLVRNAEGNLV